MLGLVLGGKKDTRVGYGGVLGGTHTLFPGLILTHTLSMNFWPKSTDGGGGGSGVN
jgi:hypothetical protein